MNCKEAFLEKYKTPPEAVAFTPYRICPLGAHIDHQLGCITGFAIDKGIHIAYRAKDNGIVEISSVQFDGMAQWHVAETPRTPVGDWADHLRGATIALCDRYPLRRGFSAVINGELPIGGLSSSAAVIITFLATLSRINGITLTEQEMIELALIAENKYVGVACGKLDQCCEVYCRKDNLLHMDIKRDSYELIPRSPAMPPYKIAIFFSGLERSLAGSKYNSRVDEAKSAAYSLLSYAGAPRGLLKDTYLTDVPREVFERYGHLLPEPLFKRANHFFTESERVERGVEAWRRGDLCEFGSLIFESGKSSIEQWETGSPELIELYNIMKETDGILGGRFSGAGFKGCCMAFIDPEYEESIIKTVRERYTKAFPHLSERFSAHICDTADGVKLN